MVLGEGANLTPNAFILHSQQQHFQESWVNTALKLGVANAVFQVTNWAKNILGKKAIAGMN